VKAQLSVTAERGQQGPCAPGGTVQGTAFCGAKNVEFCNLVAFGELAFALQIDNNIYTPTIL